MNGMASRSLDVTIRSIYDVLLKIEERLKSIEKKMESKKEDSNKKLLKD